MTRTNVSHVFVVSYHPGLNIPLIFAVNTNLVEGDYFHDIVE